ncbi:hypothetical protein THERMOT_812 [Bathymodiolus thermophilus thioautotrophic gill symbiont]|uniref:Uncharacterized protein n=1 Tax=Bathymodiolus thermophilus thioautotrophic gill symbiont TaxID=2360 RepID=A0A8H8XDZ5_9GAMM|nr:hypothetical protein THERMOT_812 [Bathymodiolus thermophilus thioautotrophic gill symbiont]CAB5503146.1 hypothetical protein THERMOS_1738 [Bathymodiolus thermophilus thioautotrophic gill symbiont]
MLIIHIYAKVSIGKIQFGNFIKSCPDKVKMGFKKNAKLVNDLHFICD